MTPCMRRATPTPPSRPFVATSPESRATFTSASETQTNASLLRVFRVPRGLTPTWVSPHSKTGLVSSSWERQYFFTQGGNLMQQGRGEVAGGLVTDLDNCSVMAVDSDDRRFCFQVTSFDGKK